LTVLLRFIPYIGAWLAAAMPVALSFAVFDDWTRPLLVAGLFAALELFSYSVLEPWLYGTHTGVSPVALLLAAAFWTWLWGLPGLFLAIPMTVCVAVMSKYIPQLEFLQVLLGNEPVLEPPERLYQRLLASNRDEADVLLEEALRSKSMLEVCDAVIVPAMQLVETDHDRGALEGTERTTVLEHISQWVDERLDSLEYRPLPLTAPLMMGRAPMVLCVPAADRADEIIAKLLESVLLEQGFHAVVRSAESLDKGVAAEAAPEAILVSALPPEAVSAARSVCKRARAGSDAVPLIVGLWNANGELQRARQRLESAGAARVVTSFAECLGELELLRKVTAAPQLTLEAQTGPYEGDRSDTGQTGAREQALTP
jgi:hypothetical protein